MKAVEPVLKHIDDGLKASLDRLFELVRFPSVGTDPAYNAECRKAATWLKEKFDGLGFEASIHETTGQPVVIGKYQPAGMSSHTPHILFYGHYDVQPADPVELWDSPPFEPQIRKGKDGQEQIFARGASDDKGQFMTFIEACRAWLSVHGALPFRLTLLIEGDEEGDTSHLDRFLAENRKALAADVAFVCDTDMWDDRTPAITTFLRGCVADEVVVTGPRIDLHSGYYGGPAVNPIKVLSRILASIHDKDGKIAIPGFYDGVKLIPEATRKEWAKLKFSPKQFLGDVGLRLAAGERRYSPLEQIWARPTAEVNGIMGGYTGAGAKTVLPSKAMAKLTFRLVGGQNAIKVRAAFRKFVRSQLPADCKVNFVTHGGASSGVTVASDSTYVKAAKKALAAEWNKAPIMNGSGGSIPVVESFKKHLKMESLLVGFAREDDSVHSPNEKYDVESFHKGMRSWARIIAELS
jgi:acetylornithine deacetylase/succinyl-diaminopimelate desuccinylase-like protein